MTPSDKEQIEALSQRILRMCAQRLGGVAALAKHLGVSEGLLAKWLSGELCPPVAVIQKAVAPLLDMPSSEMATEFSRYSPRPPGSNIRNT